MKPLNVADYRLRARRRLPRDLFEYVDRGTEDERALTALRTAFDALRLHPRVLVDVMQRSQAATFLGLDRSSPIVIAPTAVAGLLWHDGEAALARAAEVCKVPFCVATQSIASIEHIRAAAPAAELWFQLYVWQNRSLTEALLQRVRSCGVETLVLTADTPMSPKREYNQRNGFSIPLEASFAGALDVAAHPRWTLGVLLRYLAKQGMPTYAHYPPAFRTRITRAAVAEDVSLSLRLNWDDMAALRRQWPGRFVVKGILRRDDAVRAAELGADGIVVSSHSGRNLDAAVTPIEVLPSIADAVAGRLEIIADSGVRRGSDVVKLMALGARAVMVGRAPLFGLAAGGTEAAVDVLDLLADEIDRTLAFLGCPSLSQVSRDFLCSA